MTGTGRYARRTAPKKDSSTDLTSRKGAARRAFASEALLSQARIKSPGFIRCFLQAPLIKSSHQTRLLIHLSDTSTTREW